MKKLLLFYFSFIMLSTQAQTIKEKQFTANARLSFLLLPAFSPLLTLEMKAIKKSTIQLETNFINTHGLNYKYFFKERMNKHFVFLGTAFLKYCCPR